MKKLVIASIMAASAMAASAQVSVTGKVSEWVDNVKTGTGAAATQLTADATSNITVRATEDLGNGLSARVVVDTKILANDPTTAGTQIGDRQSTVGLASKLGSVDLGRNTHSGFRTLAGNDPFGAMYGSIASDVHNLRGLRLSNGAFVAANMGPVSATYDRSQNPTGGAADSTAYSVGASLMGVGATYARFESGVEKSDIVGVSTKVGATGLFYTYSDNVSATAGQTRKGNMVGASHDIGKFTVKASYGKTNTDIVAYNAGVDYNLSKRTTAGVVYREVNKEGASNDVRQIGVGLTHRF